MKTRILITTIGAAAIAAITFNTSGAFLSPRAAGNQIKTTPATVASPNSATENQSAAISPRALGNQTTTVAGVAKDVNPALKCTRTMAGSPKTIQACVANANMSGCQMSAQAGGMVR